MAEQPIANDEMSRGNGVLNSPSLPEQVAFQEPPQKRSLSPQHPKMMSLLGLSVIAIIIVGGGILLFLPRQEVATNANTEITNALQESIRRILPEQQPGTNSSVVAQPDPIRNVNTSTSANTSTGAAVNSSYKADSDNDGLLDRIEQQYGSDPAKPDTDGDSISDLHEVYVHSTDPTKKDTDGDGFEDDEELRNGFNPNGSGAL